MYIVKNGLRCRQSTFVTPNLLSVTKDAKPCTLISGHETFVMFQVARLSDINDPLVSVTLVFSAHREPGSSLLYNMCKCEGAVAILKGQPPCRANSLSSLGCICRSVSDYHDSTVADPNSSYPVVL